jgi:FkbM family methyltransferase
MKTYDSSRFIKMVRALLRFVTSKKWIRSCLRRLSGAGLLPEGLWRRLPVDCTFPVEISDDVSFLYCSIPSDTIGRALFWKGLTWWEAETIPVFYQLAKKSRVVLDIGANTGFYSLLACAANPDVEVFSFEPVPKVYSCLVNNLIANGYENRCHAVAAAVSNIVGEVDFCELEGDVPTGSSLELTGYRGNKGNVIKVISTTIDAFDLPAELVDLVKIDVETFEDVVLEGMTTLLENYLPRMILECNYDGPFQAVETILQRYGYTFYHLNGDGCEMMEHILPDPKGKYLNFLCLPPGYSVEMLGK